MAHDVLKNDPVSASVAVEVDSLYLRSRLKRTMDIIISLVGILITVAAFPVVALFIKMESRGPIFYRQTRLGIDGRLFILIKYRTMIHNAESDGKAIWAVENDPRVTRVGKILRRLYIDEFPQWWNVAVGDMSVVGPRPERPELSNLIIQSYPRFAGRLEAKPGITGLAQTEYKYVGSIGDSRHKLSYDRKYIYKASITLDLWIILRTFRRMLLRRGT